MLCFSALKHNFSDQWGGALVSNAKMPTEDPGENFCETQLLEPFIRG